MAIDAAVAAQGITLSNPIFVSSDLETGKLIKIFEQDLKMETGFYLVTPRYSINSESIAKVRKWLFDQFN